MHRLIAIVSLALVFPLAACVGQFTPSVNTIDLSQVDLSSDLRSGEACSWRILLFGPFGNASVIDAARSAGIRRAELVDWSFSNYLIALKTCVVVYGE